VLGHSTLRMTERLYGGLRNRSALNHWHDMVSRDPPAGESVTGPTAVPSAKTVEREARCPPGRHARTFPPPRQFLPFAEWPEADRRALDAAIAPLGPFDAPRVAAHWRPATIEVLRRVYARYLSWLGHQGLLDAEEPLAERLTPERLTAYLQEVRQIWSPNTVAQCLRSLRLLMRAMAPEQEWRWISKHRRRCRRRRTATPP
jgi:hypothetical protein